MEANPAITGMLGLGLVIGCAGTSVPSGQSPKDSVPAAPEVNPRCVRQANVTVRIENQSSYSIGVFFGSHQAQPLVEPFSTTEYKVTRFSLESAIRLEIRAGGLITRGPASIRTEPVVCNDATLVIGSQLSLSYFIGNVLVKQPSGDSER